MRFPSVASSSSSNPAPPTMDDPPLGAADAPLNSSGSDTGSQATMTSTPVSQPPPPSGSSTTSSGGATSFFRRWGGAHNTPVLTPLATPADAAVTVPGPPRPGSIAIHTPELKIISVTPDDPSSSQQTTLVDEASSSPSLAGSLASESTRKPRTRRKAASPKTSSVGGQPVQSGFQQQPRPCQRPCQTHSFHTDAGEVQHMEKGLLKLLDDFNSGKLRAFGQGCSMEQMERIRNQQENLAKLHFELGARQDISTPLSEDGIRASNESMDKLMSRLEKLSMSIGQLNPSAAGVRNCDEKEAVPTTSTGDGTDDAER